MSGAGRAVVLAVGERTVREQEVTVSELRTDDEETAMQKKLKDLGDLISKYAKYAAILMFFIMSVYLIIAILFS
jgi:magnesium-transporting ATPase (P-type)